MVNFLSKSFVCSHKVLSVNLFVCCNCLFSEIVYSVKLFIQWNCLFIQRKIKPIGNISSYCTKTFKNTFCVISQKACKICSLFEMFKILEIPIRKYAGPCTNLHLLLWDIYCNDNTIKKKINDNTKKNQW